MKIENKKVKKIMFGIFWGLMILWLTYISIVEKRLKDFLTELFLIIIISFVFDKIYTKSSVFWKKLFSKFKKGTKKQTDEK